MIVLFVVHCICLGVNSVGGGGASHTMGKWQYYRPPPPTGQGLGGEGSTPKHVLYKTSPPPPPPPDTSCKMSSSFYTNVYTTCIMTPQRLIYLPCLVTQMAKG